MERLPGFRDFYPEPLPHPDVWSADARQFIFDQWRATARRYGFREYDGPPLEPLELFTTKSGEEIIGQLYNFLDKGEFRAIAGGGRYNNLVKLISGGKVDLPALGFGMGDVVLLELLKARRLLPKFDSPMDVFVLIEDEALRPLSLKLVHDLRAAGYAVDYPLTPAKPDKQFKRAMDLKVARTARLDNDAYVRIRNLQTREEIVTGVADAANHLS